MIIRGTRDALISELFKQENGSMDPTFVEDFLLTQRIFMDPAELAERIIESFHDIAIRDRVIRVMLLWVNNHFIDFEVDLRLMRLLLT
jgi:Rap guanine nucleotide exchange factor 2